MSSGHVKCAILAVVEEQKLLVTSARIDLCADGGQEHYTLVYGIYSFSKNFHTVAI